MTVLGKTLAVLNLVLSVAVAGFIIVSYAARTNWHEAWKLQADQTKAAQANAKTYQEEVIALKGKVEETKTALVAKQTETDEIRKQATADVQKAQAEASNKEQTVQKLQANQTSLTAEIQRRQIELDSVKELLGKRDTRITQMEKEVQQARDAATENLIARKAMEERNGRLLTQLEQMAQEKQKADSTGASRVAAAPGAPKRTVPREDVEGLVTQTDPDGYLTLSIGSDHGLSKGNTLEVYRLKPDPKYLGTIEILQVQTDKAVAKPISRPNGVIQRGDLVSSNILGKH
jgi:hypothetical protein